MVNELLTVYLLGLTQEMSLTDSFSDNRQSHIPLCSVLINDLREASLISQYLIQMKADLQS